MTSVPPLRLEQDLRARLESRSQDGLLRELVACSDLIDFCSNDYLGLSRSLAVMDRCQMLSNEANCHYGLIGTGSSGSRLICGHSALTHDLEEYLSHFHCDGRSDSALIFNSGYDANVGFFSSVPRRGDVVLYDENCHASIRDGLRLGFAKHFSFRHNDPADLERRIGQLRSHGKHGNILVATESLFSMDGDLAPLREISEVCKRHEAAVIVDEAHATGIYGNEGQGLVQAQGLQSAVWARIHTFGKALGCHGAVVVGPPLLRQYLINSARSFIYTTALPPHTLLSVRAAYDVMRKAHTQRADLAERWSYFSAIVADSSLSKSNFASMQIRPGPIQSMIIPGNQRVTSIALKLRQRGFAVVAIRSPTVAPGTERLRFSLHAFNQRYDIENLISALEEVVA